METSDRTITHALVVKFIVPLEESDLNGDTTDRLAEDMRKAGDYDAIVVDRDVVPIADAGLLRWPA